MSKITPEAIAVFGLASATARKKLAALSPGQCQALAYEALFYAAVAQELYDRTPPEHRTEYARGYLTATKDILSALATP